MNKFCSPSTVSPASEHAFIYTIRNIETGLLFVGYTNRSLWERWQNHYSCARHRKPHTLYQAMYRDGLHKFVMEELEQCGESIRRERELDYMRKFNSWDPRKGYNDPSLKATYARKMYFLFHPAQGARYETLWDLRNSLTGGWRQFLPLPPGYEWLDKEQRELEAISQQIGCKLMAKVRSLASPVVTKGV